MSAKRMRRWLLASAAVGGGAWASLPFLPVKGLPHLSYYEWLFLLAPLVIVPLALALLAPHGATAAPRPLAIACAGQPVAALAVMASFTLQPGWTAAALALPWLAVCVSVALGALAGLQQATREAAALATRAGMLYLAAGGASLALSRAGIAPLHFTEPIVLLTAVHFHFTGFATPVLAATLVEYLVATGKDTQHRRTVAIAIVALISATPLLAIGWVLDSPAWKLVCVLALVSSLGLLAVQQLRLAARGDGRLLTRVLLAISGCAVLFGMALAALYGVGEFSGVPLIGLHDMARLHGVANGLGFSLCGLLAMNLLPQAAPELTHARAASLRWREEAQ